MILPVVVSLELGVASLGVTLHAVRVLGLLVGDEDLAQVGITLAGGLGEQLGLAGVFEAEEEERRLVDGVAHGDQAVVLQDAGFVGGAQGFGDHFALGAREHDTAV